MVPGLVEVETDPVQGMGTTTDGVDFSVGESLPAGW